MKKILLAVIVSLAFGFGALGARAEEAKKEEKAAKPDCSAQKTAVDDAKTAQKGVAKADLSSCKDKKGAEKKDCEKPLKDAAKEAKDKAKADVAEKTKALGCCKNPKGKDCA